MPQDGQTNFILLICLNFTPHNNLAEKSPMTRGRKNHQNFGSIAGLKITAHAHQQMKSRNISKKEVKKTIGTGTGTEGNEAGTTHITSPDGILVIVNFLDGIIITVVRINQKEEETHLLRSKLKDFLLPDVIIEKAEPKRPSKKTEDEEGYEISLEDYLSGKFKNS